MGNTNYSDAPSLGHIEPSTTQKKKVKNYNGFLWLLFAIVIVGGIAYFMSEETQVRTEKARQEMAADSAAKADSIRRAVPDYETDLGEGK